MGNIYDCARNNDAKLKQSNPDCKLHGAHLGPTWGRQDPGGSHIGPLKLAIWERFHWLFWPNVIYRITYDHGDIVLCFAVIKSWPNQTKLRHYKTRIMSFKFQWYI